MRMVGDCWDDLIDLKKSNVKEEHQQLNMNHRIAQVCRTHMLYMCAPALCTCILYTSRFVASSCGGPTVAMRPASFATHAHRKHLKTNF